MNEVTKEAVAFVGLNDPHADDIPLGTIHILRNHIFRIVGPPPPLRKHVFSTENISDYVIYEWSLIVLLDLQERHT